MSDIPNITDLTGEGLKLHQEMQIVLSQVDTDLVKAEISQRKRYRNKLKKAKSDIATAVGELRKLQREIDGMYDDQGVDVEDLTDWFWQLVRGAKDSQSAHPTEPTVVDA